jgi:N6-L-threonylcarbamoyladenine synthase
LIGLGIESSCDETSIAIVKNGKELLSLKISSQVDLHSQFKGVVPELAARSHLENINILLDQCTEESKVPLENIDYISFANRPGLIGSLVIGAQMAKSIAMIFKKPIITVDHLEAHLSVIALEGKEIQYPFLGLLLSGGNSCILKSESPGSTKIIIDTLDDALGEAFDKVATLLNLPYPGGPSIEKESKRYTPSKNEKNIFPKLLSSSNNEKIAFSYSGLKTSVLRYIQNKDNQPLNIPKIAYFFQESAFELVIRNLLKAIKETGIKNTIAAGGVLANDTLRQKLLIASKENNFTINYPNKKIFCTDNGAMVASLGFQIAQQNQFSELNFSIYPYRLD